MRIGDWKKRNIGFYTVDIEATPEFVFWENKEQID